MSNTKDDIFAFLFGESTFQGVWYGQPNPNERGAYWWRRHLRAALAAQVTLTMDQAKAVFDALDIGLGAASQEAAVYHEAMAGHREGEHKRLDADAAKVSAALVMVGQLIEEHEQAKETK